MLNPLIPIRFSVIDRVWAGIYKPVTPSETYAPLAQLVEQLTLNQWVPGSNPWRCTKKFVLFTQRVHLFPFRTQKLSSAVPTIPDWRRSGKIGRGEHRLAQGQACLKLVLFTWRVHLYPFRTQKLSSTVPTIPDWRRSGKIGRGQHSSLAQSAEHAAVNRSVVGSSPTGGAIWITPQFRNIQVRFEVFFFFINPYAIRLFTTFILKIFLYLRLLIFIESAAAFNFPPLFEPLMCGLDCRNNTFPHICRGSDSGVVNAGALSCRKLYNYVRHLRIQFLFDNSVYIIPHASYLQRKIRRPNYRKVFLFVKKTVVRSVALDKS